MTKDASPKTIKTTDRIRVNVDPDRLAATVQLADPADIVALSPEEVLDALEREKIAIDENVHERVTAFVQCVLAEPAEAAKPHRVAEGRPPREGEDARFIWSEMFEREAEAWKGDGRINYYKLSSIVTIDSGTVLGTLLPAVAPESGIDVFGQAIPPVRKPVEIELDSSVSRSDSDATQIIAMRPGRAMLEKHRLWIAEALVLQGDIDFATGSIDSSVELNITGTVRDGFEVKCTKSITVGGAVEAGEVIAEQDVIVRGGILGHHQGKVRAGGEIVARFCDAADLQAGGNIAFHREAGDCRLHTEGKILASQGAIYGGEIYAREGIEAAVLGSNGNTPTRLIVGIHPDVLKQSAAIEDEMGSRGELVEKVRSTVKVLNVNPKRLTSAQKEQLTELMFRAEELQLEIDQLRQRREQLVTDAQPENSPYVLASRMIHAGVQIQIGRRRTVFDKEWKGAYKIELRKINNVTEIVAVNQTSGSVTTLPSQDVELK